MPVRCVAFDADDTLWDFTTAMGQALVLAVEAGQAAGPPAASGLRTDDLVARFDRLYADHVAQPRPGRHIGSLRNDSFAAALADLGVHDPALVEHMAATYFAHRHDRLPLFAETVEVLDELGEHFVLGLVTNGKAQVLRQDGRPVPGLYAAGLDNNSIWSGHYPGGGCSIGPAMTFGYIAARHIAGTLAARA